jgi:thiol-disulfide isomerase/thioredoxin
MLTWYVLSAAPQKPQTKVLATHTECRVGLERGLYIDIKKFKKLYAFAGLFHEGGVAVTQITSAMHACTVGRRANGLLFFRVSRAPSRAVCSLLGRAGVRCRYPRKRALAATAGDFVVGEVIRAHVSTLLATTIAFNALLSPLALAGPLNSENISNVSSSITSVSAAVLQPHAPQIGSSDPELLVADAAAEATNEAAAEPQSQPQPRPQEQQQQQQSQQQQQQQWWQADESNWLELTSPTELLSFINSVQPPPAWPALADSPAPKLKLIEFYARWCGACAAAAPGLAAAASEPQLQASATFARVNVDRVKPLMKQLGISRCVFGLSQAARQGKATGETTANWLRLCAYLCASMSTTPMLYALHGQQR